MVALNDAGEDWLVPTVTEAPGKSNKKPAGERLAGRCLLIRAVNCRERGVDALNQEMSPG
mgnify:CR=1 FL=1